MPAVYIKCVFVVIFIFCSFALEIPAWARTNTRWESIPNNILNSSNVNHFVIVARVKNQIKTQKSSDLKYSHIYLHNSVGNKRSEWIAIRMITFQWINLIDLNSVFKGVDVYWLNLSCWRANIHLKMVSWISIIDDIAYSSSKILFVACRIEIEESNTLSVRSLRYLVKICIINQVFAVANVESFNYPTKLLFKLESADCINI